MAWRSQTQIESNMQYGHLVCYNRNDTKTQKRSAPAPGVVTPYWGVTGMMVTTRGADSGLEAPG